LLLKRQNNSVGSQICSGNGWLEECTYAGYRKAVGYCRAEDSKQPTTFSPVTSADHIAGGGKAAPEGEIKERE
jgi:hypothetical protein